eukprot:1171334-Karenia_brevis.AAC.1
MPEWLALNLSDNPENRLSWSLTGAIPTYRTGTSKVYFPYYKRFLTTTERLVTLGFPMHAELA